MKERGIMKEVVFGILILFVVTLVLSIRMVPAPTPDALAGESIR